MKVFISHQHADQMRALRVAGILRRNGITSYLDVADPAVGAKGEDLAAHIRREMGDCTQLLAIISIATKASQWVPWEVGVATEKDFPLATYAEGVGEVPEFLRLWPYLKSDADLEEYIRASKAADRSRQINETVLGRVAARTNATGVFYRALRTALRQ